MDEQTIVTAVKELATTLGAMSLVLSTQDDLLAIPHPPRVADIATYESHTIAIKEQVAPSCHPLLAASVREYQAGFPDRAGTYLIDFLQQLQAEPAYAQTFSPASQKQMDFYLADLKEL